MPRHSKPRGAWAHIPEPSESDVETEGELTWRQICAKVDELLAEPGARRHRFPEASEVKATETVEILPHGARRIKMNWPDWEKEQNEL